MPNRVIGTGSDAYVIGQDECPAVGEGNATVYMPRKDVAEAAKVARTSKKDNVRVETLGLDEKGAHVRVVPHGDAEPSLFLCPVPTEKEALLYEKVDELLARINGNKPTIGLGTEWFAPFGKVKQDDPVMLFCPSEDVSDAISIRSRSETFRGAYMPISAEEWR